ncbi:MAG TPA: shikimate kinase [Acidimicrobiia bacterium]|nr:shikimate kinase [Acidimicrobiia bacterium]
MTLWLVGMMGTGKSSAGRLAAERLGVEFVDVDEAVASEVGMAISELWERLGEGEFRRIETAMIEQVAGTEAVVSTGGGAVLAAANRRRMRDTGRVVWLRATPAVLDGRLDDAGDRPLLGGDSDRTNTITRLLEERSRAYEDAADYEIDTSPMSVEEVAMRIEQLWTL